MKLGELPFVFIIQFYLQIRLGLEFSIINKHLPSKKEKKINP